MEVGRDLTQHPEFPLLLLVFAGLFLLLQHRLDRHDPKLTAAPAREALLEFEPLAEEPDA